MLQMKDFQWPATVIDVIEIDSNFHHGIVLTIPVPSSRTSLRPVGYSKEYINAPVGSGKPQILLDNFQNPDVEPGSKDDLELIQERRIQVEQFYGVDVPTGPEVMLLHAIVNLIRGSLKLHASERLENPGIRHAEAVLHKSLPKQSHVVSQFREVGSVGSHEASPALFSSRLNKSNGIDLVNRLRWPLQDPVNDFLDEDRDRANDFHRAPVPERMDSCL
ncbi:LuxR family transcriptional regulator [Methylobacterium sp. ME121]|nr:LuxR family transcriptional regulator [Methylobacterium sp. ME121]